MLNSASSAAKLLSTQFRPRGKLIQYTNQRRLSSTGVRNSIWYVDISAYIINGFTTENPIYFFIKRIAEFTKVVVIDGETILGMELVGFLPFIGFVPSKPN